MTPRASSFARGANSFQKRRLPAVNPLSLRDRPRGGHTPSGPLEGGCVGRKQPPKVPHLHRPACLTTRHSRLDRESHETSTGLRMYVLLIADSAKQPHRSSLSVRHSRGCGERTPEIRPWCTDMPIAGAWKAGRCAAVWRRVARDSRRGLHSCALGLDDPEVREGAGVMTVSGGSRWREDGLTANSLN